MTAACKFCDIQCDANPRPSKPVTRSQFYLFAKFSGFHGILAALMVALRQLLPEERVPVPAPLGALRIRNKHLPALYCTAGPRARLTAFIHDSTSLPRLN